VSAKTAQESGFRRFGCSLSSAVFRVACLHFVCTLGTEPVSGVAALDPLQAF
jgi:hypothetical protein